MASPVSRRATAALLALPRLRAAVPSSDGATANLAAAAARQRPLPPPFTITTTTTSASPVQTQARSHGTAAAARNRRRSTRPLGRVILAPAPAPTPPATGVRAYSQDGGGASRPGENLAAGQSKIWSFEEMESLVSSGKRDVVIIDVREPEEVRETGRIPGAINMPIKSAPDGFRVGEDEFEDRFGFARPARGADVVVYCRAGVRSRAAAGLARDAGWESVGEYPGSWLDWVARGGRVER